MGVNRSRLMWALLMVVSAGCASPPPPKPLNPSIACLADIMRAPEVQSISGKLVFSGRASLPMVSDSERPTREQQPAIQAAEARYSSCIELGAPWRNQYVPLEVEAVGMRFVRDNQASLALLYRSEITFGQYNTHINALRADLEQRINDLRAAQQQQQDEFRRREAIARIVAPPPPLPPVVKFTPIQPSPSAVTTTCQNIGNQVICRTQ